MTNLGGTITVFDGGYDEFLEKIGWEEEQERKGASAVAEKTVRSKKDARRERSQLVQERSAALRPFKQRIDAAEARICELEEESRQAQSELVAASEAQEGERCALLGRRLKEMEAQIEAHFAELEQATIAYEQLSQEFEERLNAPS